MAQKIKITYATLSADNEDLQSAYDSAIDKVKAEWLGAEVPMFINGEKVFTDEKFKSFSPINVDMHLCTAQKGTADHANSAIAAAKAAFPGWRKTPWEERAAIIRAIGEKFSDHSLDLSALMILEVGKNRLEALGEVEETADLLRYYAGSMEKNKGFVNELGKLNPDDPREQNFSVLRPYGVWVVISPFNFPMALAAAPIAAALVTGNTVVFKGSSDTPYNAWKTAEMFMDAGLPPGVPLRILFQTHLIHRFEEAVIQLKADDCVHGPIHISIGQEALAAAAMAALTSGDKISGSHRAHHQFLAKTLNHVLLRDWNPLDNDLPEAGQEVVTRTLGEIMGLRIGYCGGRGGSSTPSSRRPS